MANAASGEEGFWTVPPGKLASQVKFFMTTDHGLSVRRSVWEGEGERSEKRGTYSLKVTCFNLSLTHSRSNKKDLGKKTS